MKKECKYYCDVCGEYFDVAFNTNNYTVSYCPQCGEILINEFRENTFPDEQE